MCICITQVPTEEIQTLDNASLEENGIPFEEPPKIHVCLKITNVIIISLGFGPCL